MLTRGASAYIPGVPSAASEHEREIVAAMAVIDNAVETLTRLATPTDDIDERYAAWRQQIGEEHEARRRALVDEAAAARRKAWMEADSALDGFRARLAALAEQQPLLLAEWDDPSWDELVNDGRSS